MYIAPIVFGFMLGSLVTFSVILGLSVYVSIDKGDGRRGK